MKLPEHQRVLFALIWEDEDGAAHADGDEHGPGDDAGYLARVRAAPGLAVTREIATWWRRYGIEQRCPFTVGLLRQRGTAAAAFEVFCRRRDLTAFIEPNGDAFLRWLEAEGGDQLLRTLARFERALLAAAKGEEPVDVLVPWDRDPVAVLDALLAGEPADAAPHGAFLMRVASTLPDLFELR